MLSGMQQLTILVLGDEIHLELDVLAGLTQLQRLRLIGCEVRKGAAGVAQLLSHLQPLQQLTHLSWHFVPPLQLQRPKQALAHLNLHAVEEGCPAAAAYAALTASSKLQYLEISYCQLLPGVWQHLFPSGRHLPNLQSLNISGVRRSGKDAWEDYAPAPEGSRLVSCCPALQCLNMEHLCNPEVAVVQGLSKLQNLRFTCGDSQVEVLQAVCHLTGLRSLKFQASRGLDAGPDALGSSLVAKGVLLQLTQLRQLTVLYWDIPFIGTPSGTNSTGESGRVSSALLLALISAQVLLHMFKVVASICS
jgi:hypothetical protein